MFGGMIIWIGFREGNGVYEFGVVPEDLRDCTV